MRVVPTDLLTSVIKDVQTELKLLKEAGQNLAAPVTVNWKYATDDKVFLLYSAWIFSPENTQGFFLILFLWQLAKIVQINLSKNLSQ